MPNRKTSDPHGDPPSESRWPLTERRGGGDRRGSDRRTAERRRGDRRQAPPTSARELKSFTGRERQIVDLLMQGMANRQIAQALGITEATVKKHLNHVYRKLGVRSRTMLIIEQRSKKR